MTIASLAQEAQNKINFGMPTTCTALCKCGKRHKAVYQWRQHYRKFWWVVGDELIPFPDCPEEAA